MVDYNRQRTEAISLIEKLVEVGRYNTEDIAFFVERNKGFSEKFTLRYIQKCLDRKIFLKDDSGIITTNKVVIQ